MAAAGRIIEVDFKRKHKPSAGGFGGRFGGGPKFVAAVFIAALLVEIALVAAFAPSLIPSGLFPLMVIIVAVLVSLGARRAMVRMEINRLHRQMTTRDTKDNQSRTLH